MDTIPGQGTAASENPVVAALARYFSEEPLPGLVSAYLFGSHATGRAHSDSDVDVAVLVSWDRHPTRRGRFDLRLRLGSALIHALRHNEVDVVLLNDAPPTLGREVVWHGIRVFCADPEADHDFLRDVQLRAVDLELFLRRMQPILLEALAG